MISLLCGASVFLSAITPTLAADTISRRDGFLLIWSSIERQLYPCNEAFSDVSKGEKGYAEISYAKCRGIIDEAPTFRSTAPLNLEDALLWLFRSRSVEGKDWKTMPQTSDFPSLLTRYPIASSDPKVLKNTFLSQDQLFGLMRHLDRLLSTEPHQVSLYGEEFQGAGTASGEKFDMYAFTAAHKTFPLDTLVKVTNIQNSKSVIVRINDRGPYVKGRDMDLSVASFESIADRSAGVIQATFQRLGAASIVGPCTRLNVFQTRIVPGVRLLPGISQSFALGGEITLRSSASFVVRSVRYPDGFTASVENWILPGETYQFKPSVTGTYLFRIGSIDGRERSLSTDVVQCPAS